MFFSLIRPNAGKLHVYACMQIYSQIYVAVLDWSSGSWRVHHRPPWWLCRTAYEAPQIVLYQQWLSFVSVSFFIFSNNARVPFCSCSREKFAKLYLYTWLSKRLDVNVSFYEVLLTEGLLTQENQCDGGAAADLPD